MEPRGEKGRLGFRISTCKPGPKLECKNNVITTHTILELIQRLQEEFGPNYSFSPESITEGGILMTNWPGKIDGRYPDEKQEPYKSFRIRLGDYGRWPWIYETTVDNWLNNEAEIIWSPVIKDRGQYGCSHIHTGEACMCVGPPFGSRRRKFNWMPMKGTTWLKAFSGAPPWNRGEIHAIRRALCAVGMCRTRNQLE
jgi:hypothetical protein